MPDDSTNQGVPQGSDSQENGPGPQSPDPVNLDQGGNPTPVGDALEPCTSAAPNNSEVTDPPPQSPPRPGTPDAGSGPTGNPEPVAP